MLLAVLAGVALGVFSKVVNAVAPAWTGNSLALWLLVAFAVGLGASSVRQAAARGCVSLVVANCAYYAWRLFLTEDVSVRWAIRAFSFWTALAVPAGIVAGALARRGREGWSLSAGGFAGEAGFVWVVAGHPAHIAAAAVLALIFAAVTRWSQRAALMAVGATAAVAGAAALQRVLLRGR